MTEPTLPPGGATRTRVSRYDDEGPSLLELAVPLVRHWKLLLLGPLAAGATALGATYLVTPTFTAATTFLPPQQQQSATASALASLGALSGLAGVSAIKTPGDQYVSLLRSVTVQDRLVEAFDLQQVYDVEYRFEARRKLEKNVRISLGKKDGLISVEVDDTSPQRAADMANRHVDELRRMTDALALTEAQQRRAFFQAELEATRDKLAAAQRALESSGFTAGALRVEPRAAAEGYARLQAEVTAAEVRLQTLRRSLADSTPEVRQQQTLLAALRAQLGKLEDSAGAPSSGDYVSKYREFKYQENLFELFSRQYELARLDESREGALIQVVDRATPPEWKSAPKRALITLVCALITFVLLMIAVLLRNAWWRAARTPETAAKVAEMRAAWRRG